MSNCTLLTQMIFHMPDDDIDEEIFELTRQIALRGDDLMEALRISGKSQAMEVLHHALLVLQQPLFYRQQIDSNPRLKTKSLRMVAINVPNPLLSVDQLPSGRYRYVRHRINLCRSCFRSQAISILKRIFSFVLFLFLYFILYNHNSFRPTILE